LELQKKKIAFYVLKDTLSSTASKYAQCNAERSPTEVRESFEAGGSVASPPEPS
jgi:hypothetical protein